MMVQELLPGSIAGDEQIGAMAGAVDLELSSIGQTGDELPLLAFLESLPDAVLDDLAVRFGLDAWAYLDDRAKRIWLVRHFHDYHRLKGTPAGYAWFARFLLDREVVSHRPPSFSFLGHSLSTEEREAWEAVHPEIQVLPHRRPLEMVTDDAARQGGFLGQYLVQTHPIYRAIEKRIYFDPATGEHRELTAQPGETQWQLTGTRDRVEIRSESIPPVPVAAVSLPMSSSWLLNMKSADRVYKIKTDTVCQMDDGARPLLPVLPSGTPLTGRWKRYAEVVVAQAPSAGCGLPVGTTYLQDTRTHERVGKRFKLYEPGRTVSRQRSMGMALGRYHLGKLPPWHGEICLEMAEPGHGYAAQSNGYIGQCLMPSAAGHKIRKAIKVMGFAMTQYEPYTIDTAVYRKVCAGELIAGEGMAGQYMKGV